MAIFEMCVHQVEHKVVFALLNHLVSCELDRFTGPNLLKIAEASNNIEYSARRIHSEHCQGDKVKTREWICTQLVISAEFYTVCKP